MFHSGGPSGGDDRWADRRAEVGEDLAHGGRVGDEGDDAHLRAAERAEKPEADVGSCEKHDTELIRSLRAAATKPTTAYEDIEQVCRLTASGLFC